MEESQLYDAQTPGHVFAYRAFRSLFVRSPDSSPGRPSNENNKENIPLPTRSPVKRSHDEISSAIRTTPKRQRTNVVSPAKSILRNPAEPTPRSAKLRDMNVTFKDVRKSASPDLRRKRSPVSNMPASLEEVSRPPPMEKDTSTNTKAVAQLKSSEHSSKRKAQSPEKPQAVAIFQSSGVPADYEGYVRNTEHEMKKLLKYGQKMRDYARKQDEENAKLRRLLQEAREENDMLKRAAAFRDDDAYVLPKGPDFEPGRVEARIGNIDNASKQQPSAPVKPTSRTATPREASATKDVIATRSQSVRTTSSTSQTAKRHGPEEEKNRSTPAATEPSKQRQATETRKSFANDTNIEAPVAVSMRSVSNHSPPTSSELPVDRIAAARERLRRRTEMRRASAKTLPVAPSMEESQVDWAGL